MKRDQAHALIRETFTQAYDKGRFHNLAINLLNRIDESKAQAWNSQYVKDAFKDHVSRYERLGTYTSPDNEKLDVLIVHVTTESKLERARTAIRNFVADHLKTRDEKDAGLVAFVSPTEKQWRFSYVKMEYATVEKESGKVGVESRLTPARRFSYIVGEGESCHTAQTRFLSLLQDTQNDPKLADIEEAFSVEAVTKEFFNKYRDLFIDIHAALEKLVEKDKSIRDEFEAKKVNTVDFAKKLMGQIVFLYFLQKKGWLGVARGEHWGRGPHDFLRRLANGQYREYSNFFNDILEPLFYDTLATDRGHEAWCNRFKCRIPFLNGGLFEPLGGYDWLKTDILLSNRLFTNNDHVEEGITGTGVLDVFDRYNFTVNEAEPLEKEVAIDPEMLGKVFENLIEENRRKGLGAYYTPREIVHYMCQESLINYLDTALNKVAQASSLHSLDKVAHSSLHSHKQDACATIYFDPAAPLEISQRNLPHWTQPGTTYYVTFRLADSLPQEKLRQLTLEREAWLKNHPEPRSPSVIAEYHRLFSEKVDQWLDAGTGSCVLRQPDAAKIVADALKHFDGERYRLAEWVVMPNHVHALVTPLHEHELSDILHSWKSFTANTINERFSRTGTLWQHESYDHIVRSEDQLHLIEQYIRDNPVKAGIKVTQASKVAQASSLHSPKQDACATLVPRQDIETFVHLGDQYLFYEAAKQSGTIGRDYPKPPKSIEQNARLIDEKLAEITVCDPAVGSGAFPVGMMSEIVRARSALTPYFDKVEQASSLSSSGNRKQDAYATLDRTPYFFKRHAIQNCLYGVDIDPGAVEIAKLRLWLSLVVDEEDAKQIKPLPNLDYKVVAGNSLLGVERTLENWKLFAELEKLKPEYFDETDASRKASIKCQIDDLIHQLTNGKEIFDFEIYFSEVFHKGGGFDITLANPPYVRQEKLKDQKKAFAEQYQTYTGIADLYVYFYERAIKLLKPGGTIAFISSNKFFRAGYGEKLRRFLTEKTAIINLIDFGDLPVFEATTYPCVLVAKRLNGESRETIVRARTIASEDELKRFEEVFRAGAIEMPQSSLSIEGWRIEDKAVLALLEKIKKAGVPLGEYVKGKIYRGITTGYNEAFVIDEETKKRLIKEDKRSAEVIKPLLRGRDIKRYSIAEPGLYLIYVPNKWTNEHRGKAEPENFFNKELTAIHAHLKLFEKPLQKRDDQGEYWWEMRPCKYLQEFEKPKIMLPDITPRAGFAFDDGKEYFCGNTAYIIVTPHKHCLGLLNSSLINYFYSKLSPTVRGGYLRFIEQYLVQIPIASPSDSQRREIESCVENILKAKRNDPAVDTTEWEREIDRLVYELYGLTEDEIKLVEESRHK